MNPMAKLAASALPGEKKYVLFAGAGVSKDAQLPSAWDLMLQTAVLLFAADHAEGDSPQNIEQWFLASSYAQMSYSELIEQLYPHSTEQQSFLRSYLNVSSSGRAHEMIAELARREIIRVIITTNFDSGIEKALEEKDVEYQVISSIEDLEHSEPLIHCKSIRIYKPHGDLGRGKLKNTPKDLESLDAPMEEELIRVLSDHGVMVIGYSGCDRGIQTVFRRRKKNFYPLFWINPQQPKMEIAQILDSQGFTYIPCTGAGQFFDDFLALQKRIIDLSPDVLSKPTVSNLRYSLSSGKGSVIPILKEFLDGIFRQLESSRPDFSKFSDYDDAIVHQINSCVSLSSCFIEATNLVSSYNNVEACEIIYKFFEKGYDLRNAQPDLIGSYRETDFDGFRFLIYEMFVGFIAALLRDERWTLINNLLSERLFVNFGRNKNFAPYTSINGSMIALDSIRNERLKANRASIAADMLKERFTKSSLSRLCSHREFMEADYLLFLRSACQVEGDFVMPWKPHSDLYMHDVPIYLQKSKSKKYLELLSDAVGFKDADLFARKLKEKHTLFVKCWGFKVLVESPLRFFEFQDLGNCK